MPETEYNKACKRHMSETFGRGASMFAGNGGEGMPRPRKWRRVCCLPESRRFGPLDLCAGETVTMAVDEYETIRLIDLDGLTQVHCP